MEDFIRVTEVPRPVPQPGITAYVVPLVHRRFFVCTSVQALVKEFGADHIGIADADWYAIIDRLSEISVLMLIDPDAWVEDRELRLAVNNLVYMKTDTLQLRFEDFIRVADESNIVYYLF
ncbi:hypothetical protein BcepSauron_188 [Burkholderia phage BcepSauron]|uniref:Uncharacterized protein n=1 Tax=Burkholderia phage BcepSauron TaxID=2530033 RepID=A0A482MLP4_9CAUD|nr:hypothetical protein H1O17_gp188 [Burkholderia phage BcepSauron]QBQ74568.1 hypothetical protein BcepSauron_188 [Burkholderia phage BcepSauron]